jgi:hypothetical protein
MFRFSCLSLILLVVVAAAWGFNSQFSNPRQTVDLRLPGESATARIEWWVGDNWIPFSRLVVENAAGTFDARMWEDWGPASRASAYITPEHWLVIAHPGGGATAVTLQLDQAPKMISNADIRRSPSEHWHFIGTVDNAPRGVLRFYSPDEMRECIPLLGAGSAPFRIGHQDPRDCAFR